MKLKYKEDRLIQESLFGERGTVIGETSQGSVGEQIQNRFYGKTWLLWEIAEKSGVVEDLNLGINLNKVDINNIVTLAMFSLLFKGGFDLAGRWQEFHKTPSAECLNVVDILELTKKITESKRFAFFKERALRQTSQKFIACETNLQDLIGKSSLDINWSQKEEGKTKDLRCVIVYTKDGFEPVYFNIFELTRGNINIRAKVIEELHTVGYDDPKVSFVQGYETNENIDAMIRRKLPIHVYEDVNSDLVQDIVQHISFGPDQKPLNMEYKEQYQVYAEQFMWKRQVKLDPASDEEQSIKMRLNIYLDSFCRSSQINSINRNIEQGDDEISNYIVSKKKVTAKDVKTLTKKYPYHEIWIDQRTKRLQFKLDKDKVQKVKSSAGFFASISYKDRSSIDEDLSYHVLRNKQEEFLNQNKDKLCFSMSAETFEEDLEGKLFILFLSLFFNSVISSVWNQNLRDKYFSSDSILEEVSSVRIFETPAGTVKITNFNDNQAEIGEAFGLTVFRKTEANDDQDTVKEEVKKQPARRGRPRKVVNQSS